METTYNYELAITNMNDEQRKNTLALCESIKSTDLSTVSQFGSQLNNTIINASNNLLDAVKGDKHNEVVELTNSLLAELNMIDVDELEETPIKKFLSRIPVVKNFVKTLENASIKYESINTNVGKIADKITATKVVSLRDNTAIQQIFDNNADYIQKAREYVLALKLKRNEANDELQLMKQNPQTEPIQIQDQEAFVTAIEKRITDIQTTEYILTQNLFQIRATQQNNLAISEKADYIVNNVMPIWRSQLALAIINSNQRASIEAQKKIQDTTNLMLRKNAEMLKLNSIDVARAAEQTVVSTETLQKTTQELIATINEVNKIHADARVEREKHEKLLMDFANNLTISLTAKIE